jgi:hypothetical protein
MSKRTTVVVMVASVLAVLLGVGGYALGAATAATEDEAASVRNDAQAEAFEEARSSAKDEALARGLRAGQEAGDRAGELAGSDAGQGAGSSSANAEVAAAAAAAEAAERAQNCGAPLFVTGYCPTDEEIAQENQAEALCGPGTASGHEQAAAQGIDCGPIPPIRP